MPTDWQRALVIAAHPDDIEYGLAAVVAAWTSEGKEVHYLLATRGEAGMAGLKPEEAAPIREEEERRSAAVVGVTEVEFLDGRDGVLEAGPELRKAIAGGIRRHRPELVVTGYFGATWSPPGQSPGYLNSPDHRALGQCALDAVADASNEWIFRDLPDPPWRGVQYVAVSSLLDPAHEVDVSDYVETAVKSLTEHRRYLELLSDTPVEEQARQIPEIQQMVEDPPEWLEFWSTQVGADLKDGLREAPGYIAFARENGTVYHTYTVSAPDPFVAPYHAFLLERTPLTREDDPRAWRKDEYPGA